MKAYGFAATALSPLFLAGVGRNGSADGGSPGLVFSILIFIVIVLVTLVNRKKQADAAASNKLGPAPSRRPAARPEKRSAVSAPGAGKQDRQRRDELKTLLEAGLISKEEYRERAAKIKKF